MSTITEQERARLRDVGRSFSEAADGDDERSLSASARTALQLVRDRPDLSAREISASLPSAADRDLARAFLATLASVRGGRDRSGAPLPDPHRAGQRAALAAASADAWDKLGALLGVAGVVDLVPDLRSRQAVHHHVRTGAILRCETSGGRLVFPAFQFTAGEGSMLRDLRRVRSILDAEMDPWTLAGWLTTPQPEIGGEVPARHLASHGATDLVLSAAERTRWALAA